MRTDPPTGDELTRLLTTMKTNVLRRADETMNQPAPARRTRTRLAGITIAIISLLIIGSAGTALATGLIPSPFTAPEAPTITATPVATPSATPSETPTPTLVPAPVSTLVPSDPSTWTIGFDEIGGVPVGGSLGSLAEAAALEPTSDTIDCPSGYSNGAGFDDPTGVRIDIAELKSRGTAVADPTFTYASVWSRTVPRTILSGSPKTDEGIRLGSSEANLFTAYPNLQPAKSLSDSTLGYTTFADGPNNDGRYLVFQVGTADSGARTVVWIQSSALSSVTDVCD